MNLFEACFTLGLILLFTIALAWVASLYGWLAGLLAAVATVGLVIGLVFALNLWNRRADGPS